MIIYTTVKVEAPDGATHYLGDLTDDPSWWKYTENSTGTFKGWCSWSGARSGWMIYGERSPSPNMQLIPNQGCGHVWNIGIGDYFRRCVICSTRESLCTICSQPITEGSVVGDGDGSMAGGGRFAHRGCYDMREQQSTAQLTCCICHGVLESTSIAIEVDEPEHRGLAHILCAKQG